MKTIAKFWTLMLVCILSAAALSACGDDDEELTLDGDKSKIAGTWKCVEVDVDEIAVDGLDYFPATVKELIARQMEASLLGEVVTIDANAIQLDGNVVVFKDSDLRWTIRHLTKTEMDVRYQTITAYEGVGMRITVEAEYKKMK